MLTVEVRKDTFFILILLLVWVLPCVAIAVWLTGAQKRYFRLYEEYRRTKLPAVDDQFIRQYSSEPWRAQVEGFGTSLSLLRVLSEPQEDPVLETARQRVWFIWWVMVTVICLGAILTVAIWVILGG